MLHTSQRSPQRSRSLSKKAVRESTAQMLAAFGQLKAKKEQAARDAAAAKKKPVRNTGGGGPTADEIKEERAKEAAARRAAAEAAKAEKARLIAQKGLRNKNKYSG